MPGAAAVLLLLLRPAASCSFVVANYNLTMTAAWPRANFFNRFRGPDATNIAGAHGWTFVHNLLSMTGAFTLQPFLSADGRVACLFNGEIYNYRALAKELTGNEDALESDGFVLQPAYARWGAEFVTRLQGEFAIVVLDLRRRRLLLSTDAFSTKPLWYATWRDPASGRERFGAASYESVLRRAGAPRAACLMAAPNEALVLALIGEGAGVPQLAHPVSKLHGENTIPPSSATGRTQLCAVPRAFSRCRNSLDRFPPWLVWPPGQFSKIGKLPLVTFDLRQHKTHTRDWAAAFREAVALRTVRLKHRVFIGLSGGYDSGAIALALHQLGVPFLAYNVRVRAREDMGFAPS